LKKNSLNSFILLIFLISYGWDSGAQSDTTSNYVFADKAYYLIDSLVLDDLSKSDRELLERSLGAFHKADQDTAKIKILSELIEDMVHEDWERYQYFLLDILKQSLKEQHNPDENILLQKHYANSLVNLGYMAQNDSENKKALSYYDQGLKIQKEIGDKKGLANTLNNIAFIYHLQGDVEKAIEIYQQAMQIQQEIGDKRGIAGSLNNFGFIYQGQNDAEKALEFYLKSLEVREEIGEKMGIATSLNNIGYTYLIMGDKEKALGYYERSLKIQEEIGNKKGMAVILSNIGFIYIGEKDYEKALDYYNKSLAILKEIGDKQAIANDLNNIALIFLNKEELKKAFSCASEAMRLAKELGYPETIRNSSHILSKIYSKKNEGMKALEMYELYVTMRDSLNNEATMKAAVEQHAKYTYEKQKLIDDAEHEKQIALSTEHEKKQKILIYSIALGLLLILVFSIFIYNRLQITRRQKSLIEEQKIEVELQKNLIEVKNDEILASITYAKRIQDAILPPINLIKKFLPDSFILYKPKDVVAGDFYWFETKGDFIFYAAADCTGHGVPGAMVSVVCANSLNRSVNEFGLTDPGEILDNTTKLVIETFEKSEHDVKDGMDISFIRMNKKTNEIVFAGAQNPLYVFSVIDGQELNKKAIYNESIFLKEYKGDKQPIGKFSDHKPFTSTKVEVKKGDYLFLFSDGFPDQFGGESGRKYMYKPFKKLLMSIVDKDVAKQKEMIEEAFEKWRGNLEQVDDVCVIGLRI